MYAGGVNISVVIPAFNEEKLLPGALAAVHKALDAFRKKGWGVEIVVCDNNSTDCTAVLAREAGARVVFEPVNQIGRARNSGAAAATGDWLVFVDADSAPTAALFEDVAEQIRSGKCLAGGSTVVLDEHHFSADLLVALWNGLSRWQRLLAGSFIFVERRVFHELGGFDAKLYAAEELELSQRLKKRARLEGRSIVVLHRHPLKTSARKLKLYSFRERFVFFIQTLFWHRRSVASREAAYLWYDGRR